MGLGETVIFFAGLFFLWFLGYQWWRSVPTNQCSICGEGINFLDYMCDACYQWLREGM